MRRLPTAIHDHVIPNDDDASTYTASTYAATGNHNDNDNELTILSLNSGPRSQWPHGQGCGRDGCVWQERFLGTMAAN